MTSRQGTRMSLRLGCGTIVPGLTWTARAPSARCPSAVVIVLVLVAFGWKAEDVRSVLLLLLAVLMFTA